MSLECPPARRAAMPPRSYARGKPVSTCVIATPDSLDLAILSAVVYASIFDYPLTTGELWRAVTHHVPSVDVLRRTIARSVFLRSRLTIAGDWILPAGRTDLIATRRQRERDSRAFVASHRGTLALLCTVPFTRLVAISGSLAHLNAGADADLDLFVVAAEGRVWTVTVLMLVVAKLLRRRESVCVNFVLGTDALRLEQTDFFTAHQVLSLRPVEGRETHRAFLAANTFVRDHFPNAAAVEAPFLSPGRSGSPGVKRLLEAALWLPGASVEWCCRTAYGWHLRRRVASWSSPDQVRMDRNVLKLHTRSHRHEVLARHAQLMDAAIRKGDDSRKRLRVSSTLASPLEA